MDSREPRDKHSGTYIFPSKQWSICIMFSNLKLYCRYAYTKPCMINRIWDLKQLWLQMNGHAWFHLQRLRWPVRKGRERTIHNENICYQQDSNTHLPSPWQESQRLRPLGHEGLLVISVLMSYRIMGYKI